jgi:hypothetical protein
MELAVGAMMIALVDVFEREEELLLLYLLVVGKCSQQILFVCVRGYYGDNEKIEADSVKVEVGKRGEDKRGEEGNLLEGSKSSQPPSSPPRSISIP